MKSDLRTLDFTRHIAETLVWVAVGITVGLICAGCITTRTGQGEAQVAVTRVDLDATIAIAQLALDNAQLALTIWQRLEQAETTMAAADFARELAERQQRIDALAALVRNLYELKAINTTTNTPQ